MENEIKEIPLTMSDDMIKLQNYLNDNLWDWINSNVGIPESRMGKPCDRSLKEQLIHDRLITKKLN